MLLKSVGMPLVEHKMGRLTRSHQTDVGSLFADLTRLNKPVIRLSPNTATVSAATQVHCHYLLKKTLPQTKTNTATVMNSSVFGGCVKKKSLAASFFCCSLGEFYWSTMRFHQTMMKYLCSFSATSDAKLDFCLTEATWKLLSHYFSWGFSERYGCKTDSTLAFF